MVPSPLSVTPRLGGCKRVCGRAALLDGSEPSPSVIFIDFWALAGRESGAPVLACALKVRSVGRSDGRQDMLFRHCVILGTRL